MQLNKYLAHTGVCSRRKAADVIKDGFIKVNNVIISEPGYQVKSGDEVKMGNKIIKAERKLYIVLNKPKDCLVTVSDEKGRRTVLDLLRPAISLRVYPVGRLDRNTTGVLLLTNDGELTQKLAHPRYEIQKTYSVVLDEPLKSSDIQKIKTGVRLYDGNVMVDHISLIQGKRRKWVHITLHSGKYRIIRRLFEALGYEVVRLDRTECAGLTKHGLQQGSWRILTGQEVQRLKQL